MTSSRRKTALVLAVLIAVLLALSAWFIVLEADHDCHGEECLICRQLVVSASALRLLSWAAVLQAAIVAAAAAILRALPQLQTGRRGCTPVTLRVKLSN